MGKKWTLLLFISGDLTCHVDNDLILSLGCKLQANSVLVLLNPEVVTSSWTRASVNVKKQNLLLMGFDCGSPATGPTIQVLLEGVTESQVVTRAREACDKV